MRKRYKEWKANDKECVIKLLLGVTEPNPVGKLGNCTEEHLIVISPDHGSRGVSVSLV